MIDDVVDALAQTPLCRDLSRDELRRIAEEGRVEHWGDGAVIAEEGTVGPRVVLLLEGNATVWKRDQQGLEHEIADLEPGAVIGEMSLLLDRPRSATVRARGPIRAFAMERKAFVEMLDAGDIAALRIGVAIARALAGRLEEQNAHLVDLLGEVNDHKRRSHFLREQSALQWRWDFR